MTELQKQRKNMKHGENSLKIEEKKMRKMENDDKVVGKMIMFAKKENIFG
jgi:hypothetical protein